MQTHVMSNRNSCSKPIHIFTINFSKYFESIHIRKSYDFVHNVIVNEYCQRTMNNKLIANNSQHNTSDYDSFITFCCGCGWFPRVHSVKEFVFLTPTHILYGYGWRQKEFTYCLFKSIQRWRHHLHCHDTNEEVSLQMISRLFCDQDRD